MEFVALFICLILSFIFSGSETALTAVNKLKVQLRADNGDLKSQKMLRLIKEPDRMITTILIINNTVNILMPTLLTIIAIRHGWTISIATTILTIILIIFGEVLPKTIAVTFAEKIAYIALPLIAFCVMVFKPITYIIQNFTNIFIRILSKGEVTEASLTKADIRSMVDIATTTGAFQTDESDRIKEMMDFPEKDVSDVLGAHRTELVALHIDASYEEVRKTIIDSGHSRYPVYTDDIDTIVGLFFSKKYVEWSIDPTKKMKEFVDYNALFVVASIPVEKVFKMMMTEKKHLAIVLDEYGGTLGIVSHEDIIEEMIGQEIEDESDQQLVDVFASTPTTVVCSGRIEVDKVNELLNIELPNDDYETMNGFILAQFFQLPKKNDTFHWENIVITINEVEDHKIQKLTVTKQVD
ncbi:hemolysin family protein [Kurthia sibirica]|uniref:Hemolysin n=1 Tax=Kurthia sibirica TaxID=202750 RepID=A0A2U3APT6_9BACL|nr:CNNM domain-containing protein [Kurthia sibirica]PWI26552.1 hemolysin [Kurthia sibirica]GEK32801.1 hypothetical protein KSI01_03340 [Kurthia sibirica]